MKHEIIVSWDDYTRTISYLIDNLEHLCWQLEGKNKVKITFQSAEDMTYYKLMFLN